MAGIAGEQGSEADQFGVASRDEVSEAWWAFGVIVWGVLVAVHHMFLRDVEGLKGSHPPNALWPSPRSAG